MDDDGWMNRWRAPCGGASRAALSQSGNFLRGWLHLGFNQNGGRQPGPRRHGRSSRTAHRAELSLGAARRRARALPGGKRRPAVVAQVPGPGARASASRHPRSLRSECHVPEGHRALRLRRSLGAEAHARMGGHGSEERHPAPGQRPSLLHASTTHGGANVANPINASLIGSTGAGPGCPGNNFGTGILAANPLPHTQTVNAIRVHFRNWVMNGVVPPASRYPTLRGPKNERLLVEPTKDALGFPTIPLAAAPAGWRTTVPEAGFINPVLDYDWGPPSIPAMRPACGQQPPPSTVIGHSPYHDPTATSWAACRKFCSMRRWARTSAGTSRPMARPFHKGQLCDYVGGIPFAKTHSDRMATRPAPQWRRALRRHDGYVVPCAQPRPTRWHRVPAAGGRRRARRDGAGEQRAQLATSGNEKPRARGAFHAIRLNGACRTRSRRLHLGVGLVARAAVALLDLAHELVALAGDRVELVAGEFTHSP